MEMEVLLDTNFIISCILKKIDFLEELEGIGFRILLPREVLQELKDLKKDKTSHEKRVAIDVAMKIFSSSKRVEKMTLGHNIVDDALIEKGNQGIYIATLDNGIKNKIPNRVIIDSARKSLKIESEGS